MAASWGPLLDTLMDLPPEDRQAYLEEHCDDEEMRLELLSLVRDDTLDGFLAEPAAGVLGLSDDEDATEVQGAQTDPEPVSWSSAPAEVERGEEAGQILRIGVYRILEELGSGGMGRIFLADQTAPVARTVALKLMKNSYASSLELRRFVTEGQTMARLQHPNVARIYDVGTTAEGHPFLVMEYVEGERISKYCDREKLSVPRRLELFLQVCAAVQHSHLNRVLHRDLKPSNILVTRIDGKATVKLIDFGIAKDLAGDRQETLVSMVSGTPGYMSPEALTLTDIGIPVDTRTDVYSLGVLLVEILVGRRPFQNEWSFPGMRQEREEPVRPSRLYQEMNVERTTKIAARRSTVPGRLVGILKSDLDWISLRALAFNRSDRYASCDLLAEDVRNYLGGEPVQARPPSWLYLTGKAFRRHYKAVAMVAVLLGALVAGFVARTQALAEAEQARDDERRLRVRTEAVSDFLTQAMVDGAQAADPFFGTQVPLAVVSLVRAKAEHDLQDESLMHADVLALLAKTAAALNKDELVCDIAREAMERGTQDLPAQHPDLSKIRELLADCPVDDTQ